MSTRVSIHRLPQDVINRIAAGEVVQRPSAALKELVENSLDAGATCIRVTVRDAGLQLLQVEDNGTGIAYEDLPYVAERFATSKLVAYDDLCRIGTFGFRGEALASMSYVSLLTVHTRHVDSPVGYRCEYKDGHLRESSLLQQTHAPIGTSITIENMFYNYPVRRDAFRTNTKDEVTRMLDVVQRYALQNGSVSFTFRRAERSSPDLHIVPDPNATTSTIPSLVARLYRNDLPEHLLTLQGALEERSCLAFTGYVSGPFYATSRKGIYLFFVNGRAVECASLRRACDQAYLRVLPKGAKPFVYLSLALRPESVDVNVHPSKLTVHFLHEDIIAQHVHNTILGALTGALQAHPSMGSVASPLSSSPTPSVGRSTSITTLPPQRMVRVVAERNELERFLIHKTPVKAEEQKEATVEVSKSPVGTSSSLVREDSTNRDVAAVRTSSQKGNDKPLDFNEEEEHGYPRPHVKGDTTQSIVYSTAATTSSGGNKNTTLEKTRVKDHLEVEGTTKWFANDLDDDDDDANSNAKYGRQTTTPTAFARFRGALKSSTTKEESTNPPPSTATLPGSTEGATVHPPNCSPVAQPPPEAPQITTTVECTNPVLTPRRFPPVYSKNDSTLLSSVRSLLEECEATCDVRARRTFPNVVFVGRVDANLTLLQGGTALYLVHLPSLLESVAYQSALRLWARHDWIRLHPPIAISTLRKAHECTRTATRSLPLVQSEQEMCAMLWERHEMLQIYFQLRLERTTDDANAQVYITTIPALFGYPASDVHPCFQPSLDVWTLATVCSQLSLALEHLSDERRCIQGFARVVAAFYKHDPRAATADSVLSPSYVEHHFVPFLRHIAYLPPSHLFEERGEGSRTEDAKVNSFGTQIITPRLSPPAIQCIATTEALYRVFERC